jgi:shikimate kinase
MAPRVVLVGPPGAGKSVTGKALARLLHVDFRDTDADVETNAGTTIADLFVERGEEHFRALEREAVAAALASHDGVLALGGGAVLDEATRGLLREQNVAFLDVGIAAAARRVGFNRDRPLLLGNPRAQLLRLMEARRPFYDEVATITVTTDDASPHQVAETIAERLGLGEKL